MWIQADTPFLWCLETKEFAGAGRGQSGDKRNEDAIVWTRFIKHPQLWGTVNRGLLPETDPFSYVDAFETVATVFTSNFLLQFHRKPLLRINKKII
jgi:hypothetical protein